MNNCCIFFPILTDGKRKRKRKISQQFFKNEVSEETSIAQTMEHLLDFS